MHQQCSNLHLMACVHEGTLPARVPWAPEEARLGAPEQARVSEAARVAPLIEEWKADKELRAKLKADEQPPPEGKAKTRPSQRPDLVARSKLEGAAENVNARKTAGHVPGHPAGSRCGPKLPAAAAAARMHACPAPRQACVPHGAPRCSSRSLHAFAAPRQPHLPHMKAPSCKGHC
jgi:hypothetical protein